MATPFNGVIKLDVRDSTPDWDAVPRRSRRPRARRTCWSSSTTTPGCAAWSPYGGRINMPTLQRLADNGLTYTPVAHDRAVLADPLDAS